jgi:hypothetical protein
MPAQANDQITIVWPKAKGRGAEATRPDSSDEVVRRAFQRIFPSSGQPVLPQQWYPDHSRTVPPDSGRHPSTARRRISGVHRILPRGHDDRARPSRWDRTERTIIQQGILSMTDRKKCLRLAMPPHHSRTSSAGLTRGSIFRHAKHYPKKRDGRVKPGHDGVLVGHSGAGPEPTGDGTEPGIPACLALNTSGFRAQSVPLRGPA